MKDRTFKTPTEELRYIGQMLTATTEKDKTRIKTIIIRLKQILKEI